MSLIVNDVVNYAELASDSRLNNSSVFSLYRIDPVTRTASFAVSSDLYDVIFVNGSATVTVTLPEPSPNYGRVLHFKNISAFALNSASSNVVPLGGGALTNGILTAVVGRSATLVSNGTSWVIVRAVTPV